MAKRSNKKKAKNTGGHISPGLVNRVIGLTVAFLSGIGFFKLGLVGTVIDGALIYLFGYFGFLIYALALGYAITIIYRGTQPVMVTIKMAGLYLGLLGMLLLTSIPSSLDGLATITSYLQGDVISHGGLIGVTFFSLLGILFDASGTIAFSILLILLGLGIIAGKSFVEYQNKIVNHSKQIKQNIKKNISENQKARQKEDIRKLNEKIIKDYNNNTPKAQNQDPISSSDTKTELPVPTLVAPSNPPQSITPEKQEIAKEELTFTKPAMVNLNYQLPPIGLLSESKNKSPNRNREMALKNADRLAKVLQEFGVVAKVSDIFIGPSVTKFELTLEPGTRVNKITALHDDIKLALATKEIRIEAPIPGKAAIGIEVANEQSSTVAFKDVLKDIPSNMKENKLLVGLGKDISGKSIFVPLNKTPHLLVAGATGSGKSVCINTIICSLLMRATPEEVKLILVDPKKVELSIYNDIPHLLSKVVTDPKKAAAVLHELVAEMELRYDRFLGCNARNIETFNEFIEKGIIQDQEKLPYIVVILDEVADLMMVASKDVEDCIMRISQKARAAGIHMILATQRPSTDIITGVIKANIPSRIAFAVSSSIDSRTILDSTGAEKLLGKGDMLLSMQGSSVLTRLQGCFVSDEEVQAIVDYVKSQQDPNYIQKFEEAKVETDSGSGEAVENDDEDFEKCRDFVMQVQKASTSLLQRHFRIGYNKAARIIDRLEAEGVIGPQSGSKPREVYIRANQEEI